MTECPHCFGEFEDDHFCTSNPLHDPRDMIKPIVRYDVEVVAPHLRRRASSWRPDGLLDISSEMYAFLEEAKFKVEWADDYEREHTVLRFEDDVEAKLTGLKFGLKVRQVFLDPETEEEIW